MKNSKVGAEVNSAVDEITLEIVERYKADHPELSGNELYKLIESENSEDGLPPFWDGEALESIEFEEREYDGTPIEACPDCGGEVSDEESYRILKGSTENAIPLDLPGFGLSGKVLKPVKRCECDQGIGDEWRNWFNEAKASHEREYRSREGAKSRGGLSAFVLGNPTLTNVALEISRCCNVPEELAVCGILSAISSALGKGLSIEYKHNGKTPLGLFIVGFMNSGEGKTASMDRTLKPLYDKQAELREMWNAEVSTVRANIVVNDARTKTLTKIAEKRSPDSKEAAELVECLETAEKLKKELIPRSLWMGDFTFEAQRNVLNGNGEQITMLSDDAGRSIQNLLGLNNKLQMPEDLLMLAGYSGSDFMSDRAAAGNVFIPKVWASLFWLAQPDKIELLTKNTWIVEGGFLARCLLALFNGEAHVQSDEDVSPTLMAEYDKHWNQIFKAYREEYAEYQIQKTIKVSLIAKESLKKIEEQAVASQNAAPREMKPFAARAMENLWRIVGVLHVARHLGNAHNVPLSDETVDAGVKVLNYFRRQQMRLLGSHAEEKQRERITRLIDTVGERITMRNLVRKGWDENEVLSLVKQFPKHLTATNKEVGKSGGRPSIIISRAKPAF